VTGGGSGIGRAIAIDLASAGVRVVIAGRRAGLLEEVVAEIVANGKQAIGVPADICLEDDIIRLVRRSKDTFGPVDIVVSNAGISGSGPIHDHSVEAWDQVMATNLRGPFLLARHTLPQMRERRKGHFIHISSESGLEYYPGNGAYGVSKHALNALGEYIQAENQDHNIRVDTVCPGMVVTPMSEGSKGLNYQKCLYPADISELVFWLLTRRSNIKIGRPILIQTMENPWQ
jgi:NAD(P)-dependent dehydrogenase (short-subunit alcohol dehydrogenase family)